MKPSSWFIIEREREMKLMMKSPFSSSLLALAFCCFNLFYFVEITKAQPKTDPSEARALNSIFQQWGISAPSSWNISGELCTGSATDATKIDSPNINPAIKCDCSFDNGTTCHVTEMKVYEKDAAGVIPEEFLNLTFLTNLNLGRNYLTGPLPAFIGKLTTLLYMTFGVNALYGTIPKELGNLQNLKILGLGGNNFSGSLPSELGTLTNLQQLYMDNAGLSGEIPSTFANLRNLQTVWASSNQFTGKIDVIGYWTELKILRLQGNSFEGPIPSSFSNLTSLTDLRMSEVFNGSSLDFIKNMTALTILILRNNMIAGTIPFNMSKYEVLQHLDLSFNNLTGQVPNSLFNLSSLGYLFLGTNNLSGILPSEKSPSLLNIDLSYNKLSGSFPSWVTQQDLQLNLVANNFIFDNSNMSILPSGLDCLQRNFSCNRDSPRYSSFAINCGGQEMATSSRAKFEEDNATLGAASYYVTGTKRWAVSNIGRFLESNNAEYTRYTTSLFTNTLDLGLFQSSRLSPGSLRYYGLGLENGIYTVSLQFAEASFPSSGTWDSIARRYFDIYVQGTLVSKDFDIKKEAGGASYRAVQKDFNATVSENYLEIHLFWAGKGTCCLPSPGTYGPSISSISATPDFKATVGNLPPTAASKTNRTGLIVGIVVGVVILASFFALYILRRRKSLGIDNDEEFLEMGARPNTFSYAELKIATEDFNPANKLGEGGFGPVYKGRLPDGRAVAVKQLSVSSRQGKSQFVTEIATISAVQHRNLVKLYGCCIEGDKRLLVYEYLENRSLDQALFRKNNLLLNWPIRYEICLGTARGLAYLHEESRPRIVHRDVKASNILLDADLSPKISDFGLAKLYDDEMTHISTRVAGTIGYLAPEYAMRGYLTEKADVFGFGVVALEVLSGRPNSSSSVDSDKIYLLEWAWYLHENDRKLQLIDPTLPEFDEEEAIRLIGVALLCIQASPSLRPSMSRVVAMLLGDMDVSIVTSRPSYLTDLAFRDDRSSVSGATSRAFTGNSNSSQSIVSSTASTGVHEECLSAVSTTQPILDEIIEGS
ncbi:putative LRR receptor-like serine/threonine-protein kinase At1g56140 [Tasmannia lanceolata]|uniref:putative LRR receptor-like serine/threonine-protein kinase At1g56140 n=1 Tax=Tasmannia lanceolata TaxID=3420 RepID=UPI00406383C9